MKAMLPLRAPRTALRHAAPAILLSLALALMSGRPVAAAPYAASPVLRTITIGLEPAGLVEDPSVGHALVFNTWDPSAMVVDVRRGTILRTLALGSKFDFVWSDVDPLHHRFVLSLPRGVYSQGGGNAVYLLDSRSGAVLKVLQGLRTPVGVAVDPVRAHIFIADTHRGGVLEYDSRGGALERFVPSCRGTEDLALSSATGHLFVRCGNGTILMHDLATGAIISRMVSPATGPSNTYTSNAGTDTEMILQEQTHRLIVANLARGAARLYDSTTGRLIAMLPSPSGFYAIDAVHHTIVANAYTPNACTQPSAGRFQVLDGASGTVLATHTTPYTNLGIQLANPFTGHLLAGTLGLMDKSCKPLAPGWLAVLDPRSGRVLRQLPAGYNVTDLQMDRRSGLLLLESRGTSVQPGTLAILDLRQL